jgi:uncharacterized protein (TIGR00255 family)
MIQSMTGFGRGEASSENYKITIEMKSVNHRYCDISVRLPRKLNYFETIIRNQVKGFASRGKIDVFVGFEDITGKSSAIHYNKEVAEAYLRGIRQLSAELMLENTVDAYQISKFPEVFTMDEPDMDEELLEKLLKKAVSAAGKQLVATRKTEGEKLYEDLLKKLDILLSIVNEIEKRGPEVFEEHRRKIREKVTELLGDTTIDESVLATELVMYADKICVDEEIVRLRTHILHMKETLKEGENIGRKLDFITQEMNRESNTILSKSTDIAISDNGILLKTEIEKIREQIQNIE